MKTKFSVILLVALMIFGSGFAFAEGELEDGNYYTLYDEDGNVLLRTAIIINVGDKFIDHNNIHFVVTKVDAESYKAWARKLNDEEITKPSFSDFSQLEGADERRIGLYYTHSGESFVPTDGYAQTDRRRGGIYDVGAAFAEALEEYDVDVINSQKTHFPYSGSYRRSRRTATEIISEDVDAIFDIHRDATPAHAYLEEIDGETVTQVLIVVGNQNPARSVNEEFALQLKAVADETTPDLVKGIFYARGGYNQDLHPRALLLEMGAHTNKKEDVIRGAILFASVVQQTLYGEFVAPDATEELENNPSALVEDGDDDELNPQVQSTTDAGGTGRGGLLRGFMLIALLTIAGGGGYLLISVGDTKEIERKLRRFVTKEFANSLVGKKGRNKK